MTDDSRYQQLREQAWRRPLEPGEQAELERWLEAHPEARAGWEAERALAIGLRGLPDVPVSSNFEARVMDRIRQEASKRNRGIGHAARFGALHWRWLPRLAFAAFLLAGGIWLQIHFQSARQADLAASLVTVSEAAGIPGPDVLADFEAIQAMSRVSTADEELIRLLQ